MRHQNIFWGGVLVVIGTLLLLHRLDVLSIDWWALRRLWPFLLIFWGVSILPLKAVYKAAAALLMAIMVIFAYVNMPEREIKTRQSSVTYEWDDEDTTSESAGQLFTEPWDDGADEASVDLNAAAGSFRLGGTTGELIVGRAEGNHARYIYKVERTGRKAAISIREEGSRQSSRKGSDFSMMLNPSPVWSFNFDIGAADFDFDLSAFKVSQVNIDAGASSINLKIGDKQPETSIDIDAGASSINIEIPEGAGCELVGSTVLSNRELDGFTKISKGKYRTAGFDTAQQKIYVKVDAAVSNFGIKRTAR